MDAYPVHHVRRRLRVGLIAFRVSLERVVDRFIQAIQERRVDRKVVLPGYLI